MGAHHAVAPHGNCAHGKMTWISWRSSTCHPAGAFVPPTRTGSKHIHRPIWSPRPHAGSKPVPGAGGVVGPVDVLGSGDVGCGEVGSVVVGGLMMLVVGDVGSELVGCGDVGSAVVGGTTMLVVGAVGRDEVGWAGDVGGTGGTVLVVAAAVDDAVGTSPVVDDVVEWLVAGGSATTVPGPVGIDGALVGCIVGTASALVAAATERAGTGGSDVAPLADDRLAPASLAVGTSDVPAVDDATDAEDGFVASDDAAPVGCVADGAPEVGGAPCEPAALVWDAAVRVSYRAESLPM